MVPLIPATKSVTICVAMSLRGVIALAASLLATVLFATAVLAHEGEKVGSAKTKVEQAIALIREAPDQMDAIMDHVGDALMADDTSGVNLDLVKQAKAALDANDLDRAEVLLEESVGACPAEQAAPPAGAWTPPASTKPCTVPPHIKTLASTPLGGTEEGVIVALGALAILGGGLLAWRLRP